MVKDREIQAHKEWLGFLQPVGLVVSPTALNNAQMSVNRNVVELQQRLSEIIRRDFPDDSSNYTSVISDFPTFTVEILGWQPTDLVESPEDLAVSLPEYSEILQPTYTVPDPDKGGWLMLVQVISSGTDLDRVSENIKSTGWHATPQAKFERLLREKEIPVGILCNGTELRLVYAPRGESSGHLTFPVQAMCEVSGRLILGAMQMLLEEQRVFNAPTDRRLVALLQNSRKYQNEVSTKLSEQVLDALWELLRGFQAANDHAKGFLLDDIAQNEPQHIYGGLITVLLRLVFLLYAEDEGLMPQGSIYTRNYSVTGLYERLREDAGNYPDTMEQRYGAWAWLLSLFRLVYDGGCHADLYLPARHGQLFDPDEYAFLEGRSRHTTYKEWELIEPPRISDGVIHKVLQGLLVLDGERLSYRSLDVEQIGSVYEAVMGYEVKKATTSSIGVWSKPKGAKTSVTVVVSVDEVLNTKANDRAKYLKEVAGCEISGKSLAELKQAKIAEDLIAALGRKISPQTPALLATGSLYLQPGEERRRSGSHYTPRALTEPIVKETLRPVLEALGERPTPEQILALKVCDLAVGSGAFLVEACRQLAEKLVEAWNQHDLISEVPSDEEPLLYARRLVAQRCLYGVDKNPFAVNLAKLSLWLVTLAKKHPFTFLDHALKCGDSLVGLTRDQLVKFNWEKDTTYDDPNLPLFNEHINKVKFNRDEIQSLGDENYDAKRDFYQATEELLHDARIKGDLVIASFFAADKDKARKDELKAFELKFKNWQINQDNNLQILEISKQLRQAEKPVNPFNWELEFPEVFDRDNPGFDAIVGNPPFAGKNTAINAHADGYMDWLKVVNPESHGNSDLVAHFYRRAFALLRKSGCFGLIATNTIAQGDTRSTGLRYICENGGTIYNAQKRLKWPGLAAVVVSVVNVIKQEHTNIKQESRGINSPSESENPLKRIDENIGKNSSRFQATSAIRPEIDFRAGVDAQRIEKNHQQSESRGINSPSESENPLKRIDEYIGENSSRFQATSAIRPEIDFRAGVDANQNDSQNDKRLQPILDGKKVDFISAFLFKSGGNKNPAVLLANADKSFIGSYVLGMGFTFDDSNPDATSIAEMQRLIAQNTKNQERIFPYIGGEEVNSSPTHEHHRYVINFGEMSEAEAREYPDLMQIVEEKVKGKRGKHSTASWWQFERVRGELFKAIAPLERVLVISLHSQYLLFAFLPANCVFSHALGIFADQRYSFFCIVQSYIHEIWARFFSSTLGDGLRYTPSDCFQTFPFPKNWETNPTLETIGKEYYEYRAALMVRNNQGLTDTYNRFHDPDEYAPEILKLRELHTAMDKAVLDAYGWSDIPTDCDFILDYEEEEDTENSSGRQKKKPWRYRWREEIHDEVLARLLDLNQKRAEAEILGGKGAEKGKGKGGKNKSNQRKSKKVIENAPAIPGII
ncbi:Eco57I restriction-modification methylase domain-containing protein [Nostoc sp. UHCC 0870]|uniref:Eco57I restriction-modification methylase domain-containing protein n=1 Tax=Nostoc sp. UHCC 0870 TaxID=2914041 RepID=UPI001EDFBE87|nr:DNA methyltransferase [Nostoc sp. UHCC 0870]UKO98354.1 N-6 DNA methylase [Nostoc sp. UHCC 0870]